MARTQPVWLVALGALFLIQQASILLLMGYRAPVFSSSDDEQVSPSTRESENQTWTMEPLERRLQRIEGILGNLTGDILSGIAEISKFSSDVRDETHWLLIGIPTLSRRGGSDYLGRTLEELDQQFALSAPADVNPNRGKVGILVVNNEKNPVEHRAFSELARKYSNHSDVFHFVNNTKMSEIPDGGAGESPVRSNVRKQTRDIYAMMDIAVKNFSSSYFLFMEDDFELCEHGFWAVKEAILRAKEVDPRFFSIRMGYGMNGIIMQGPDLPKFSEWMLRHQHRRPPDHLVVEWFIGESPEAAAYKNSRKHFAFRYNMFHHLGVVSTLRRKDSFPGEFATCQEELLEPIVWQVEAFDMGNCSHDIISPCKPRGCQSSVPLWSPPLNSTHKKYIPPA